MNLSVKEPSQDALMPGNESARPERQLRTGWTHREATSMSNDSISPATPDDLRWWLDKAPTLRWTWAKTYADFAPHWYVRGGTTPGFSREDSVRVGRIVRTFGEPGKFWKRTNLYLFTEDRARKFWCVFSTPPGYGSDVRIVNLAHADKTYGPQADFDQQRLAVLRLGDD